MANTESAFARRLEALWRRTALAAAVTVAEPACLRTLVALCCRRTAFAAAVRNAEPAAVRALPARVDFALLAAAVRHTKAFSSCDAATSKDFTFTAPTVSFASTAALGDGRTTNKVAPFSTAMADTKAASQSILKTVRNSALSAVVDILILLGQSNG